MGMDEIPVSRFKANCAAVLDDVERTGKSVTITRRGKPIAEITPHKPLRGREHLLGCMAGEIEIVGDIVGSIWTEQELDELEAEWLKNWDEIEATGNAIAGRNGASVKRRKSPSPK